jgi:hypothetical protein
MSTLSDLINAQILAREREALAARGPVTDAVRVGAIQLLCQNIAHGEGGTAAIERLQRVYVLLTKAEAPPADELIAHCRSKGHARRFSSRSRSRSDGGMQSTWREMPEPRPDVVPAKAGEGFAGSRPAVGTLGSGNVVRWPGRRSTDAGWMKR